MQRATLIGAVPFGQEAPSARSDPAEKDLEE